MRKIIILLLILILTISVASCAIVPQSEPAMPSAPAQTTAAPTQEPTTAPTPVLTAAPTPTPEPTQAPVTVKLEITDAYPSLSFERPLFFTVADTDENDCYVVEQGGKIMAFPDDSSTLTANTFLDISDRIDDTANEKGLLGLAFHPDFGENGYFYVNYTNKTGTVVSRFTRQADNQYAADPDSEQIIITFDQPFANHNGGHLEFGPDGYLYISTGDGGKGGDPLKNGQNRSTLLGKILRIDVDSTDGDHAYAIPADNPYAGNDQGYREEIFAYGLRNPWRFSFDDSGVLWLADVGQNAFEEIDIVVSGGNYGWNVMEATHDYEETPGADKTEMILPIWEYAHDASDCITGGYVYGGGLSSDLAGKYIYGDFASGKIWALWFDADGQIQNQELIDTALMISSFGVDANGDLRIVDLMAKVYRLQVSED